MDRLYIVSVISFPRLTDGWTEPSDEEGWFRGRGLDRVVPRGLGLSTFLTRRSGGLRSFGTWPARRRQMEKSRGGIVFALFVRGGRIEGEGEGEVGGQVGSDVEGRAVGVRIDEEEVLERATDGWECKLIKEAAGLVLYMCSIIRRIRMQACSILGMYEYVWSRPLLHVQV